MNFYLLLLLIFIIIAGTYLYEQKLGSSLIDTLKTIVLYLSIFFMFWSFALWIMLRLAQSEILYFYMYFDLFACTFGVDKTAILFIFLTNFLIFICIVLSFLQVYKLDFEYLFYLIIIQVFLNMFFCTCDLLLFYICFEGVLIPMYLMIGTWGSRERRIHANYQFFLYTLCGSIFMLMSILLVHVATGTTNLMLLANYKWFAFYGSYSLIQLIIWVGFFIGFAIKVPMLPFHLWLPEAHVEAPTGGSVLLAGLLLKLGGYGFVKILLLFLPYSNFYFVFVVSICALVGLVYGSFTTTRQNDLKKIIAYTSVAHMNLVILGLFTNSTLALYGSLFLMLSHGLVSSGLFASIGMIYDRMHTRIVLYYSGLAMVMPLFAVYFFILSIANFGFPGTSSFPGELFIFLGLFKSGQLVLPMLAGIGFIVSAFYSIWLYNRICFGLPGKHMMAHSYLDLMRLEHYVLFLFISTVIVFGFCLPEMAIILYSVPVEEVAPLVDGIVSIVVSDEKPWFFKEIHMTTEVIQGKAITYKIRVSPFDPVASDGLTDYYNWCNKLGAVFEAKTGLNQHIITQPLMMAGPFAFTVYIGFIGKGGHV